MKTMRTNLLFLHKFEEKREKRNIWMKKEENRITKKQNNNKLQQ